MNSTFVSAVLICMHFISVCYAQLLTPTYYDTSCPNVLTVIRRVVENTVSADQRNAAALLRLHYHDCFVQGCDASVLLDDTANFTGEKSAGANINSLRGFEIIDEIKTQVEAECPGVVSCADIVAVAAREGVVALNGPSWTVPLGRRDSTTAEKEAPNRELPAPSSTLGALVKSFSRKGFTASEMVTLSGAHSIGKGSCRFFRKRIYNDTNLNATYAAELRASCPRSMGTGDFNLSPLDSSPTAFNNDYYQDLKSSRGLFHSDQVLFNNGSTDAQVSAYAGNSATFFNDFADVMAKMSIITPLTGTNGEIRSNCRRTN